jgi:hypothetical protein
VSDGVQAADNTAARPGQPAAAAAALSGASPFALCVRISASSKGLELPCSSWQAWLPQVVLREAAVAKLGLRFLAQQQQQQQGQGVLLPAEGPVVVWASLGADGTVR